MPYNKENYRRWAKLNKEKIAANWKRYYENNKKKVLLRQSIRSRKNTKDRARNLLQRAVREGRVEKLPCQVCGDVKVQGHHEDYSKPLQVIWLCHKHHVKVNHP